MICPYCKHEILVNAEFCPVCGKPLTDEAVQIVMERLEEMQDDFA